MPPKKNAAVAKVSFKSKELLSGDDLMKCIDHLDKIIPVEQQVYHINNDKEIDQKEVLRDMVKMLKRGALAVSYLYSRNAQAHGRQYARNSRSVQSLSRVLRHTLCKDTYRDFDIKNCHPTIALHYCKTRGWDVPFLEEYTINRDALIQDLMEKNGKTRDEIKQVILSVMNGGKKDYNDLKYKSQFLFGFFNEIQSTFEKIMELPENKDLTEEVIAAKKRGRKKMDYYDVTKSVVNKVWVDIENNVLNTCIQWLQTINISVEFIVLMFDGFMLPKHECANLPEDWAERLSDYVAEHSESKIRMSFTEKVMDEGVDLSQFQVITPYAEFHLVDPALMRKYVLSGNDKDLADLMTSALKDVYRYDGSDLWKFYNHRWNKTGAQKTPNDVASFAEEAYKVDMPDDYDPDKWNSHVKDMVDKMKTGHHVKAAREYYFNDNVYDPEFQSRLDSKASVLGFNNGVYDFDMGKFREGRPEDYVTLSTGYDYVPLALSECGDAEKFLREIVDADTYSHLLGLLASLLRGGNPDHKANFWVGKGSNGKSVLLTALKAVMGHYYGLIDKEVFTTEKKHAGGAEPHILNLRGQRVGVLSETEEDTRFFASNFKRMASQDVIKTRGMYSNKEVSFVPLYQPIIATNCLPKFSSIDDAVARRIRLFTFPYSFVEKPINEEGSNKEPVQKLIDVKLQKKVESDDFRNQLLNLMLLAEPVVGESQSMKTALMTYFSDLNPVEGWFNANYEPDEKATVPLQCKDLLTDYNNSLSSAERAYNALRPQKFVVLLERFLKLGRDHHGARFVPLYKRRQDEVQAAQPPLATKEGAGEAGTAVPSLKTN